MPQTFDLRITLTEPELALLTGLDLAWPVDEWLALFITRVLTVAMQDLGVLVQVLAGWQELYGPEERG